MTVKYSLVNFLWPYLTPEMQVILKISLYYFWHNIIHGQLGIIISCQCSSLIIALEVDNTPLQVLSLSFHQLQVNKSSEPECITNLPHLPRH